MSNVLDKSCIHRSYPKLAYGSIYFNQEIFGQNFKTLQQNVNTVGIQNPDVSGFRMVNLNPVFEW